MKRELFLHFAFWFAFFVFITLIQRFFSLSYWQFWVGGILGVVLPDIDHLIYAYFIKPQDLTSQRINHLVDNGVIVRSLELLYETRNERKGLIFHSVFFQIIFWILTFWMMSSSGSLFGKGLALSFALHLSIDQIMDITELKSFDNWIKNTPFFLDLSKAKVYWLIMFLLLVVFGVFM